MATFEMHCRFSQGELLFRQGDPSDYVLRIDSGSVEILREAGDVAIVLGSVTAGEFVGEMGVIENRPRSATARASTEVMATRFDASEFFQRVSADPRMAQELMLRLSVRLREIEDKIADDLPLAHAMNRDDRTLVPARSTELELVPDTKVLRDRMGVHAIKVDRFPFVVGRKSQLGERVPKRVPDLVLDDRPPFRMSRQHFMISTSPGGFVVRDLDSALGTTVNGEPIGSNFRTDLAGLQPGRNQIIAGGFGSDFAFRAVVR